MPCELQFKALKRCIFSKVEKLSLSAPFLCRLLQIRRSEVMKHVRLAAPEPALLNQELTQLGFLSLVQH